MVAVDFSPRIKVSTHRSSRQRRLRDHSAVATRRIAHGIGPWAEAHGYPHRLAPRDAPNVPKTTWVCVSQTEKIYFKSVSGLYGPIDMDWIPSITTTGALAIAAWLGRNLIATRLAKSVEHEFNEKMEKIRSDFRTSEETLKGELRARESEILALRNGVLSALSARQVALDKRRLEAVDELWSAVVALAPAKTISLMMSVFNFEAAANETAVNEKARQLFEILGSSFDPKSLKGTDASKSRPFVSPMVWALYSAYSAIVLHGVAKLLVLKTGVPGNLVDQVKIAKLIRTVLPDRSSHVDKYGTAGYHSLLDEIEERLLSEINSMLFGKESDKDRLEQAASILQQSNEIIVTGKVPKEAGR